MLIVIILKKIVFYFCHICQISILWKTRLLSTKIYVHVYYYRKCRNTYLYPFTFCKFFTQTEDNFVSSHGVVYRMLWWTVALTLHACRYYVYWILGTGFVFPFSRNYCHKILKQVQLHLKSRRYWSKFQHNLSLWEAKTSKELFSKSFPSKDAEACLYEMIALGFAWQAIWRLLPNLENINSFFLDSEKYKFQKDKEDWQRWLTWARIQLLLHTKYLQNKELKLIPDQTLLQILVCLHRWSNTKCIWTGVVFRER